MDIEKSIRENQLGAKLHVGKVLGGVDTIEKSVVDDIQKSKPAVAGEIREWSGKKYKKQPNGKWVEVSESHGMTKKEHQEKATIDSANAFRAAKKSGGKSSNSIKYDEKSTELSISGHKHREISSKLSDKEHDEEELK